MPRRPVDPDKVTRWMAFLRNHKDAIAAMDFFTAPTVSLRMLYVLFVIEHSRRRIVHFDVMPKPPAASRSYCAAHKLKPSLEGGT